MTVRIRLPIVLTLVSLLPSAWADSVQPPQSPNEHSTHTAAAPASESNKVVPNKADEEAWLAHRLVVPPAYPAKLAAARVTGTVDARLRISPKGELVEILQISSTPDQPEFVAAVREVLPRWAFRKELDKNCETRESVGWLRIYFEIDGSRPVVSASKPKEAPWLPSMTPPSTRRSALLEAMRDSFPRAGRRARVGADVAVAIDVDGNTGLPAKIRTTAVDLDWGHVSSRLEMMYADAAEEGMKVATFPILPDQKDKTWRTCIRASYRISQD